MVVEGVLVLGVEMLEVGVVLEEQCRDLQKQDRILETTTHTLPQKTCLLMCWLHRNCSVQ